jgi:demethylmenaquinone methyltransferase/2-methoxy-6-polyprenyl-1,4-benzoquinol methylase
MLRVGRDHMINAGHLLPTLICDAEKLLSLNDYFDRVSVDIGLHNMTHKDAALLVRPAGNSWRSR